MCFGSEPAVFRQVKIVDWTELAKELAFFSFSMVNYLYSPIISIVSASFMSLRKKEDLKMVVERRLCIDNARGIDPQVERSVKTMNRARNT